MKNNQIINPHANFFEKVFSRKDVAFDFVKNYLPEKIVKRLNISTIQVEKKSFIGNDLKATQSDILFKVKTIEGNDIFLYVLIEHKSYPDRWVMLQLLGYIVKICEYQRDINREKRKKIRQENKQCGRSDNYGIEKEYLYPVIPVILYHGTSNWNITNNFSDLFYNGNDYKKYLPNFDYQLIDTGNFPDDAFNGDIIIQVSLMVMKHIFDKDFDEQILKIFTMLADFINQNNEGINFLEILLRYIGSNKHQNKEYLKATLKQAFKDKGDEIMKSFADIWIDEGRKEGRKEGLLEEAREMLLEALNVKFKNISQAIMILIKDIKDRNILRSLLRDAILAKNLNEFQHRLETVRNG
ncbi:Transposase (putative), YhgA-like protein [Candidatus Magnetomorum sp. HK-1]|nr:Transposase (putative), YhgA-like protein [Candidatus Magnetomorum sp. HK-1]